MNHRPRLLSLLLTLTPAAAIAQQPPTDAAVQQAMREVRAIRDADAIVIGRVLKVHESPGIWCGIVVTLQDVTYHVEHGLYGVPASGDVRVGHLLVAGSPLVCDRVPMLRPELFYVGARMRLCLHRNDDGSFLVNDETYGVRAIDPAKTPDVRAAKAVRLVLDLPALQPYLQRDRREHQPLCVRLNDALPLPLPVTAGGQAVEFLPPELLRGQPHVVFDALEVAEDQVTLKFSLPAEGVVGSATCVRHANDWIVESSQVAERK